MKLAVRVFHELRRHLHLRRVRLAGRTHAVSRPLHINQIVTGRRDQGISDSSWAAAPVSLPRMPRQHPLESKPLHQRGRAGSPLVAIGTRASRPATRWRPAGDRGRKTRGGGHPRPWCSDDKGALLVTIRTAPARIFGAGRLEFYGGLHND